MAELLATATPISIAQLTPDLSAPSTRCIRAVVTVIWPYSSSTSTLQILLAEHDFRLRRAKGQVRVQFSGSSAKSIFEAGIGSGDEVILSLDGADWTEDGSAVHTPGRSIDWELKFSERLVLKIQQNETKKTTLLDIDHPALRPQADFLQDIPELAPLPTPPKSTAPKTGRPGFIRSETNEWSSPAFVKRARVSYGSLFESGYDIFAGEDGTVEGRERKRARFNLQSGAWRYSSLSQSPEPSQADEAMVNSGFPGAFEEEKPLMADEGCQTLGFEDDIAAEALADLSRGRGTVPDGPAVPEAAGGIQEVVASSLNGENSESQASVNMPPLLLLDDTLQQIVVEESTRQHSPSRNMIAWGPAPIDPIPSDIVSLLPQNERFDSIFDEAAHTSSAIEGEDLYGISPTVDGYPRDAAHSADVKQATPVHDNAHLLSEKDGYETLHQNGDHQSEVSYPKLPSRSISPDESVSPRIQVYPEPEIAVDQDFVSHTGPYYGERLQSYPDIDGDHLHVPSAGRWDFHTDELQSSNMISLEEHEISHDVPMQKLLARHISPGGVVMSRSQSGHSEMIDLTEDSDEGEELPGGSQTDNGEDTNKQLYQQAQDEDQSDDGAEGYESLLYDRDGSQSVEDEFDYSDEHKAQRPGGFFPVNQLAPGQVADEDEEEDLDDDFEGDELEEEAFDEDEREEEGSYDTDSTNDDEDGLIVMERSPLVNEPEVIDLLSSDEEDKEDDNESSRPSELGDGPAAKVNVSESVLVEVEESELRAESDIENSDEVIKDTNTNGSLRGEPQFAGPITMEESRRPFDGYAPRENEMEDVGGAERDANIGRNQSDGEDIIGSPHHIELNARRTTFVIQSQSTSYGGHDGASDGLDGLSVAPRDAEDAESTTNVDGNQVLISEDVTYPVLPLTEKGRHFCEAETAQKAHISETSKNDQLPTPDATQVSQAIAPDTSFGSINSFHPLLDKMEFTKTIFSDTQDSMQQEDMNEVEDASGQAFMNGLAKAAPEGDATETLVKAAEYTIEESIGDAATTEATYADAKATTDTPIDTAQESIKETALSPTPNIAADFVEDAMIETIERGPVTPRRSERLSFSQYRRRRPERSPSINMGEPTTPDYYDASVELAMAALDSPSKQDPDEQRISEKQLRIMLSRPLQTNLGNFTTLKLVRFNLEKKLDVLAIVTSLPSEPQRAKNGLRHYHLRFSVTDSTIGPNSVISVNIFRPYKTALPTVHLGEAVLLRNFLVKSERGAGFALRSDEGSSWTVFKHGGGEEVRGPPVEYGDEEREHIAYLKAWYHNLDSNSKERLEKVIGEKGTDIGRSMSKVF